MIAYKHTTKVVALLTAFLVFLCLAAVFFPAPLVSALGSTGVAMDYESRLFDRTSPIRINIQMDTSQWDSMLDNATQENYYSCDVEIEGETFYQVGIRPKGNTSLTSIAADLTTDRYSLKLEFDQYVEGQSCFGLDKLILNNNYADATNMKEALVYDMYRYLGADASLYNYAAVYVNGEYWGLYLALEAVEDSFLLRNYGSQSGELYKPDSMELGGQDSMGSFSSGSSGANLNYTDDALDSYSAIWDGAVSDSSKSDHRRVITALKNISEGNDLDSYMDVDNLLKYMAVHVFSVNTDSLSGNMAHNYYLYESSGRLNMLPWDYNLAFGGMNGDSASAMVNDAIDSPWAGTHFFDTLMEDENYLARYHAYLRQLVEEYILGGGFEAFYTRTRNQIDALVETDPTAFYSYSEYTAAAQMLCDAVSLRGQSVLGQLDGSIPSTDSGQRGSAALVDCSALDLSVMGSMDVGGGRPAAEGGTDSFSPPGSLPEGFDPSQVGGDLPEGFDPSQVGGAGAPKFDADAPGAKPDTAGEDGAAAGTPAASPNIAGGDANASDGASVPAMAPGGQDWKTPFGGGMPGMDMGGSTASTPIAGILLYAGCLALALIALLFAARYKRKNRRR